MTQTEQFLNRDPMFLKCAGQYKYFNQSDWPYIITGGQFKTDLSISNVLHYYINKPWPFFKHHFAFLILIGLTVSLFCVLH